MSEWTKLNLATTERWRKCQHRYRSDETFERDVAGVPTTMYECTRCGVPTAKRAVEWASTSLQLKSARARGNAHSRKGTD